MSAVDKAQPTVGDLRSLRGLGGLQKMGVLQTIIRGRLS